MMEYAYNPNTWKTETEKQEFKDIAMSKPAKNSLVKKNNHIGDIDIFSKKIC